MNFISFSFLSFLASFGSLTFVLLSGLFMYLFFLYGASHYWVLVVPLRGSLRKGGYVVALDECGLLSGYTY